LRTIYAFRESVDDGGLISYGIDISQNFRRAADYVVKIMKGAKPGNKQNLPADIRSRIFPLFAVARMSRRSMSREWQRARLDLDQIPQPHGMYNPSRKAEELPVSEDALRGWYWTGVIIAALALWIVWYMLVRM
jgi:hypothetical protein